MTATQEETAYRERKYQEEISKLQQELENARKQKK